MASPSAAAEAGCGAGCGVPLLAFSRGAFSWRGLPPRSATARFAARVLACSTRAPAGSKRMSQTTVEAQLLNSIHAPVCCTRPDAGAPAPAPSPSGPAPAPECCVPAETRERHKTTAEAQLLNSIHAPVCCPRPDAGAPAPSTPTTSAPAAAPACTSSTTPAHAAARDCHKQLSRRSCSTASLPTSRYCLCQRTQEFRYRRFKFAHDALVSELGNGGACAFHVVQVAIIAYIVYPRRPTRPGLNVTP